MKTIHSILALLALTCLSCFAGTPATTCCPSDTTNWQASPFMSYLDPEGADNDGLGGGVLIETALNDNLFVGGSLEGNSGPDNQFAALISTTYKFDVCPVVTPYVTASGGYQYLGESGALARVGAGLEVSITESIDAFSDWQYGWDSNGIEQQVVRLGVKFSF